MSMISRAFEQASTYYRHYLLRHFIHFASHSDYSKWETMQIIDGDENNPTKFVFTYCMNDFSTSKVTVEVQLNKKELDNIKKYHGYE